MSTTRDLPTPSDGAPPGGLTVHDAHHAVRDARLVHCRHGRARTVHGTGRNHRMQVSHYRAVAAGAPTEPRSGTSPTDSRATRRRVLTVLAGTAAAGVLFLLVMRLASATNDKLLAFGVYLIVVAGALWLNMITIESVNRPAQDSRRRTP